MLTKEDIILLFLENPDRLVTAIWYNNVPKSDEIRTLICELGDLRCIFWYAVDIDKKFTKEAKACLDKNRMWKEEYKQWVRYNCFSTRVFDRGM